jgi:hypothetical protein
VKFFFFSEERLELCLRNYTHLIGISHETRNHWHQRLGEPAEEKPALPPPFPLPRGVRFWGKTNTHGGARVSASLPPAAWGKIGVRSC